MIHKPSLWLCCILICWFSSITSLSFSQQARHFSAEDILNLKNLSDPQISPSGDKIAFVVTRFKANRKLNDEIWFVSADGKTLKKITKNSAAGFAPRWSPDGEKIAFISKGDDKSDTQIYLYSLQKEKLKKLTNVNGNIKNFKWLAANNMIAFLKTDSRTDEAVQDRQKGNDAFVVGKYDMHTRLWTLNIDNQQLTQITVQDMTVWSFNFSPDGKKIAVLASSAPTAEGKEYQSHLSLIDVQSGNETILTHRTNPQASPAFSADGKWIAYIGPVGKFKERGIIKVISLEGGKPLELLKDYAGNVWDLTWHPNHNKLIVAMAIGPIHTLSSVDLKGNIQNYFELNHSIIPYWGNYWSVSSDGKTIGFLNEKIDTPKEIWIANLDGSQKQQLTHFNDYLQEVELAKVEAIKWKNNKDNVQVEGIVVKPTNFVPGGKYPLLVWLHGGPAYNWGLGIQIRDWAQLFASRGYVVLLPNFRGSSGYGMKWMTANVENWGEGPMSDVMSGVDHLIKKEWVDEHSLFVGGRSYGGYLTSWIITHTKRFNAAYVGAGITDLRTEYALTDEPSFLVGYFNSTPYDNPEIYLKNSPITFASDATTPVLIIHGEKDIRVPISQAYQFNNALKHHKVKTEMLVYPREFHSIREYVHQIDLMNRVLEWFDKYSNNIIQ